MRREKEGKSFSRHKKIVKIKTELLWQIKPITLYFSVKIPSCQFISCGLWLPVWQWLSAAKMQRSSHRLWMCLISVEQSEETILRHFRNVPVHRIESQVLPWITKRLCFAGLLRNTCNARLHSCNGMWLQILHLMPLSPLATDFVKWFEVWLIDSSGEILPLLTWVGCFFRGGLQCVVLLVKMALSFWMMKSGATNGTKNLIVLSWGLGRFPRLSAGRCHLCFSMQRVTRRCRCAFVSTAAQCHLHTFAHVLEIKANSMLSQGGFTLKNV